MSIIVQLLLFVEVYQALSIAQLFHFLEEIAQKDMEFVHKEHVFP
jgi:hypothetical protein